MSAPAPDRIVEAALFSAGKPLLEQEIAEATGLDRRVVAKSLKSLAAAYAESESALEVARGGSKWAMQLKAAFTEKARSLARMEVPKKVLKTLALIAFHQPLRQSELKSMIGSVVYDHVHDLHERGLVGKRKDGSTRLLTTTDRFVEYFGIDATDRHGIRTLLAKRVGLDPEQLEAPPTAAMDAQTSGTEAGTGEEAAADEASGLEDQGQEGVAAEPLKASVA